MARKTESKPSPRSQALPSYAVPDTHAEQAYDQENRRAFDDPPSKNVVTIRAMSFGTMRYADAKPPGSDPQL